MEIQHIQINSWLNIWLLWRSSYARYIKKQ